MNIPPLRERLSDIEPMIEHFIHHFNRAHHKKIKGMAKSALQLCLRYPWPGNVRELENVIERAVILSPGDFIVSESLPPHLSKLGMAPTPMASNLTLDEALAQSEERLLLETLESYNWNRQLSARALGISRTTLFNKMRRFNLIDPRRLPLAEDLKTQIS